MEWKFRISQRLVRRPALHGNECERPFSPLARVLRRSGRIVARHPIMEMPFSEHLRVKGLFRGMRRRSLSNNAGAFHDTAATSLGVRIMKPIHEHTVIEKLTGGFRRSSAQVNALQTSDTEILRSPVFTDRYLAITTDSIAEEIASGLYHDPWLAGWMTVTANLSDLAAVGAEPLGMLVSEILPKNLPADSVNRLQQGMKDALETYGTFLLGGDTNTGSQLMMTGTAVGTIKGKPLSRLGANPDERLYSSGPLGSGNAFAFSHFAGYSPLPLYRPSARLAEGQLVRNYATCCIDTSDGLLAAMDQLMRLNAVGFEITRGWENALHRDARALANEAHFSPWLLLAGQHGEFELIFTIPSTHEDEFLRAARSAGWEPLFLGTATARESLLLPLDGNNTSIDTAYVRNLANDGSIERYIENLLKYDAQIRKGVVDHA